VEDISDNGRYVIFTSYADNLSSSYHNDYGSGPSVIFTYVRDRQAGTTTMLNPSWAMHYTNANLASADGTKVELQGMATVGGPSQYVLYDIPTGTMTTLPNYGTLSKDANYLIYADSGNLHIYNIASQTDTVADSSNTASWGVMSRDDQLVAYAKTNAATNGTDVYEYSMASGTTRLVASAPANQQGVVSAVSDNGRYIAYFLSGPPGGLYGGRGYYADATTGEVVNFDSGLHHDSVIGMSGDGSKIAFESITRTPNNGNNYPQVFMTQMGELPPPDTTPPTVGSFTLGSKASTATKNFTAPASDNVGVTGGEWYYGTDPGQGNGTAMTFSGGNLSGTLSNTMPVGVYPVYVRAVDAAGNWSAPASAQLVVTQAGTTNVQASGSYTPSTAHGDQLPQLGTASYVLSQYHLNVSFNSSRITASSNASYTYTYGNSPLCGAAPTLPGCQQLTLASTGFSSLVYGGTNNGEATITGTANVTVGGTTTSNPFTITLHDASKAGGANQFTLTVYDPSNPGTVLYQAVNAGTVHVN